MGDVADAIVLNAGACTDTDMMHVATDDGLWPNRAVVTDGDIADDNCATVNEHTFTQLGCMAVKASQ